MKKVTFLQQEDGSFKYVGLVEWRPDTYEEIKDTIVEFEISEEDFDKVEHFECKPVFDGKSFSTIDSEKFLNKYKADRLKNYPDPTEYVDAQVKKSSSDPEMQAAGIAQEAKYLADCLAVKQMFPKPILE